MTSDTGVTTPLHEKREVPLNGIGTAGIAPGNLTRAVLPGLEYYGALAETESARLLILVVPTKGGPRVKGAPPAPPGDANTHPGYPKNTRGKSGRGG